MLVSSVHSLDDRDLLLAQTALLPRLLLFTIASIPTSLAKATAFFTAASLLM